MRTDLKHPNRGRRGASFGARAPSLLAKVVAAIVGAVLLIGAVAISIVLFAVVLAGLLVFGIYLWWRTRHLRKQMRSWSSERDVIEGEVIREVRPHDTNGPRSP